MGSRAARDAALTILVRVEQEGSFVGPLLERAMQNAELHDSDRALLQQIVKGTLQQRSAIDATINRFIDRGVNSLSPYTRGLLRLGAYQVMFLDRIPQQAAVNDTIEVGKNYVSPGEIRLLNAVLRKVVTSTTESRSFDEEDPSQIATQLSHPEWLVRRWIAQFGAAETVALCRINNARSPLTFRAHRNRISGADLITNLAQSGIEAQAGSFSPDCVSVLQLPRGVKLSTLPALVDGMCIVQDESSALVAPLLDPKPGMLILDLCAAPGGKTTHLAALSNDQAVIVALDPFLRRLASVIDNCERGHFHSVAPVQGDGREIVFARNVDSVLIDAPCSGLGVLGKRSDARWQKGAADFERLNEIQDALLDHSTELVGSGGVIVYSTCSIDPIENDEVIDRFFERNPNFELQSAAGFVTPEVVDERGFVRTLPQRHGIGGAFAARLVRG